MCHIRFTSHKFLNVASVKMIHSKLLLNYSYSTQMQKWSNFCRYEKYVRIFWFQDRQREHNIIVVFRRATTHLIQHNVNNVEKQPFTLSSLLAAHASHAQNLPAECLLHASYLRGCSLVHCEQGCVVGGLWVDSKSDC